MPLNWDAQKIEYFKNNPDELWVDRSEFGESYKDVNSETKSLIFGSMAVGLTAITEKNQAEWYARWKVLEKLEDMYVYATFDGTDLIKTYLSSDIVKKHIGLSTNVGNTSNLEWCKRFAKHNKEYSVKEIQAMVTVYAMEYRMENNGS